MGSSLFSGITRPTQATPAPLGSGHGVAGVPSRHDPDASTTHRRLEKFPPKPARSALALGGWLAVTFSAAAMGALFLPGECYARLQKPAWNPPNWIFGPVWTALYTIMAIAAWLVWKRGGWTGQRAALSLFLLQLFFNALWSPLFFGLHLPGPALADLLLLWLALAATVAAFWKARRLAGAMLLLYLAWVTFAGALNFAIWRLNPS